jgi:hypothetical protein
MALNWRKRLDTILEKLRLKPLSLAEKCRIQFGAAVVFSLILALWVPYFWMGKLTEKNALDSGVPLLRVSLNSIFACRHMARMPCR